MKFQVTCRELVFVNRTYEIEAISATEARSSIKDSYGNSGEQIAEDVTDSYEFCGITSVCDENGIDC